MTNTCVIRPAHEDEIVFVREGFKHSATECGVGERFVHTLEFWHAALFKDKICKALVAEIDQKLVGFLIYSITHRNFALHKHPGIFMQGVYVNKTHRRQKIGTKLVEELLKLSKKNSYGRIEFNLLTSNHVGELFLKSLHLEEVDYVKLMRLQF